MAIEALIPEEQKEHIDTIEREMKTVLVNGMLDLLVETGAMERVMNYAMDYFGRGQSGYENPENRNHDKENNRKESKVRKVTVGE